MGCGLKLPLARLREKDPTAERLLQKADFLEEQKEETRKHSQTLLLAGWAGDLLAGGSPRISQKRGRNAVNKQKADGPPAPSPPPSGSWDNSVGVGVGGWLCALLWPHSCPGPQPHRDKSFHTSSGQAGAGTA